jgi:glucosamine kinase
VSPLNPDSTVVGIDGGGTKTLTLLADAEGTILARASGGGSNQNVVGAGTAAETIARTIVACCDSVQVPVSSIGAVVAGLAGAGSPDDRAALLRLIVARFDPAERDRLRISIETDARIALEGAFDGGPGIVVIAGTGSTVIVKNTRGEVRLMGGWGRILGDEGSGYFLGREALRAMLQACDSGSEFGPLEQSVSAETGLRTRDQIIGAVYRGKFDIPSIAPQVLRAAERGDQHALAILRTGASLLAGRIAGAVDSVKWNDDPGVVFVGGLIDAGGLYAHLLEAALRQRAPKARMHAPLRSPAEGAVRMARIMMMTGEYPE